MLTLLFQLFQIFINRQLRTDFAAISAWNIPVAQFFINHSGFYCVTKQQLKDIQNALFQTRIEQGDGLARREPVPTSPQGTATRDWLRAARPA